MFPQRSVLAGAPLLRQDESADAVLLLQSGIVKLVHGRADGRSIVVGLRRSGSLLGTGPALRGGSQTLSVVAVTPCRFHRIPAAEFADLVRDVEEVSHFVHVASCVEVDWQLARNIDLACLTARERLESLLASFEAASDATPSARPGRLPLRNWEMAQLLSITPQYLSRLLRERRTSRHSRDESP